MNRSICTGSKCIRLLLYLNMKMILCFLGHVHFVYKPTINNFRKSFKLHISRTQVATCLSTLRHIFHHHHVGIYNDECRLGAKLRHEVGTIKLLASLQRGVLVKSSIVLQTKISCNACVCYACVGGEAQRRGSPVAKRQSIR